MTRLLLVLSLLLASVAPPNPTLRATCHSLTVTYQAPDYFNPRSFYARALVNDSSIPLVYVGITGKDRHTWRARVALTGELRAQGLLQHRILDYLMQTQVVKLECPRPWGR